MPDARDAAELRELLLYKIIYEKDDGKINSQISQFVDQFIKKINISPAFLGPKS